MASAEPARGGCPDDPDRAAQAALAAPRDAEGWPAEVRLRMLVRGDGAIDCVSVVGATRDGFDEECLRQVRGRRWRPRRDREGRPIAAFVTYLCQFEPKQPP